ncbi:hypothetical protein ACET3Z_024837 [Daucus carota]
MATPRVQVLLFLILLTFAFGLMFMVGEARHIAKSFMILHCVKDDDCMPGWEDPCPHYYCDSDCYCVCG